MAEVTFLPEQSAPPLDATLEDMGARSILAGKPIRVRMQPDVYDTEKARYQSWAGLVWALNVESVEEGRLLRVGLTQFFKAFGKSATSQKKLLRALGRLQG